MSKKHEFSKLHFHGPGCSAYGFVKAENVPDAISKAFSDGDEKIMLADNHVLHLRQGSSCWAVTEEMLSPETKMPT